MAQGYEQGSYGPGGFSAGAGGGAGPGGGSSTAAAPTGPRRARVGLIAFIAVLIELVVIAAGFNQAVSKHLLSYVNDHNPNSFVSSMVRAGLVFSWRLTPEHGDNQHGVHVWLSQIVGDVGVLVLTALLILAIARGPITWGRAFFGIWMTVIVATCLAAIPALLVTKNLAQPGVDKATYAVFSGPNAYEFFAGAALGLLVALITSIVAISTRRPGAALAPAFVPDETSRTVPEPPPPYYGNPAPSTSSQPTSSQPTSSQPTFNQPTFNQPTSNQPTGNRPTGNEPVQSNRSEAPTAAYPVVPAGAPTQSAPTAAYPVVPAGAPTQSEPTQSAPTQSEPTTTLPRFDSSWHPGQRSGEPPKNDSATSELPRVTPAQDPKSGGDSTTTLPRFAGGETGTWPPQPPSSQSPSSQSPPSQSPPSQSPPSQSPPTQPAGGQPTAAFPLPPDDEDLGQHPDHD